MALCENCGGLVKTTFERRDVPIGDGRGPAFNVLVQLCDVCGSLVAIPAQSKAAVREAIQKVSFPLEANLPAVYLDVLDLAAFMVDQDASTEFRRVLLSYFVHRAAQTKAMWPLIAMRHAQALALYPEKRGLPRRRLSLKVPQRFVDELKLLQNQSQLNTTGVLKALVLDIQDSIINNPQPDLIKELQYCAAVMV